MNKNITWEQTSQSLKAAEQQKATHIGEMEDAFLYIAPHRSIYRTRNTTTDRKKIYDTTALESCRALTTHTQRFLIPQNARWSMLEWSTPQLKREFGSQLADWMEGANQALNRVWQKSNFYIALDESLWDVCVVGTGAIAIVDAPNEPLQFMSVPIAELFFLLDYAGNARDVFRCVELTNAQVERKWPGKLPTWDTSPALNEQTRHIVEHEHKYTRWDKAAGAEITYYCYSVWDKATGTLLSQQHSPHQTYFIYFWDRAPKQTWGEGPGLQALPDIRTVNLMVEDLLTRSAFEARGLWQTPDETINEKQLNGRMRPGSVVKVRDALTPVPFPGNFSIAVNAIQTTRSQIRALFYNNALNPDPSQPTYQPATEVAFRRELFAAGVGQGPAKRIDSQLLLPLARGVWNRLVARGDVEPPSPQYLQSIGIPANQLDEVFRVTIYAAVQRAQEMAQAQTNLQGYISLVQAVGDATVVSKQFDIAKLIRSTAEKLGVELSVMRDPKEVERIDQIQQQQEQMLAAMNLVQQAGGAMQAINQAQTPPQPNMPNMPPSV